MNEEHGLQLTIDALAAYPEHVGRLFRTLPRALWHWAPPSWDGIPSEKLTALEQICHLRDIEIEGYTVRFERTRRELLPVLVDLGGEDMAQARGYAGQDPSAALADFAQARAANVARLRGCEAAEFGRTAVFEGRRITLAGLVHNLASHDYQHLAGLQWLMARGGDFGNPG